MTPERKQWWDSLPRREKMLREQIEKTKIGISYLKFALQIGCFTDNDKKWVISRIKKKKVTLTALKHELDNKAVASIWDTIKRRSRCIAAKSAVVRLKILGSRTAAGAAERLWR